MRAPDQNNRQPRNPVSFSAGSSVVADITVSQVAEGTESQLLTFTRKRRADAWPEGAALSAAIATVLAAKSAPDVNLSPGVEAEARGLGRAIADKIIAYVEQQGWATKSYSPPPSEETKPATTRPEEPAGRGGEAKWVAELCKVRPLPSIHQKRTPAIGT